MIEIAGGEVSRPDPVVGLVRNQRQTSTDDDAKKRGDDDDADCRMPDGALTARTLVRRTAQDVLRARITIVTSSAAQSQTSHAIRSPPDSV